MAGTLFVVATPIGNLEDITLRALRVLREVDLIAAEDTRRTARLLAHYAISTPMLSFHEHNTRGRIPQIVERLAAGQSVAVVSDAGTPGVSDPGSELIEACIAAGVAVDPIPGPSAALAAAVASGFPIIPLTILGFPPSRSKDRKHWLEQLAAVQTAVTFFEAPHRIAQTLKEAWPILGERQIVLARELTKFHQQFIRGTAQTVADQLTDVKGEVTVVVEPAVKQPVSCCTPLDDDAIAAVFGHIAKENAASHGQLVAEMARRLGMSRRAVYAALERAKANRSNDH
jgi:16S rRNA (cytidine1402-2'-O)-methyltransferase